jgi:hypothetical protein
MAANTISDELVIDSRDSQEHEAKTASSSSQSKHDDSEISETPATEKRTFLDEISEKYDIRESSLTEKSRKMALKLHARLTSRGIVEAEIKGSADDISPLTFYNSKKLLFLKNLESFADNAYIQGLCYLSDRTKVRVVPEGKMLEPSNILNTGIDIQNWIDGFVSELISVQPISHFKKSKNSFDEGVLCARYEIVSFVLGHARIHQDFWSSEIPKVYRRPSKDEVRHLDSKCGAFSGDSLISSKFKEVMRDILRILFVETKEALISRVAIKGFVAPFGTIYNSFCHTQKYVEETKTRGKKKKTARTAVSFSIQKPTKPWQILGVRHCEISFLRELYEYPWKRISALKDQFEKKDWSAGNEDEFCKTFKKNLTEAISTQWELRDQIWRCTSRRRAAYKATSFADLCNQIRILLNETNKDLNMKEYAEGVWDPIPLLPESIKVKGFVIDGAPYLIQRAAYLGDKDATRAVKDALPLFGSFIEEFIQQRDQAIRDRLPAGARPH